MRTLFAILLLTTVAIRPLCQLGTIGYYQLHIDTIIEKYCVNKAKPKLQCNGKCYLSKQLLLKQESKNTDQKGITNIVEAFFPVFFHTKQSFEILLAFEYLEKSYDDLAIQYSPEPIALEDPPPQ